MNYRGIHHLAMATKDMDETIRFWRDLLGMRLVAGLGRPGHRQYFFQVSDRDFIAFFEWPEVERIPEKDHGYPVKGAFVFDHACFEVEQEDDLWRLKDALDAGGFWVSEVVDHGFIHSVYSFDPNGIAIEFAWSVPHVNLGETPLLVDSRPSKVALEGPDPQAGHWPPALKPAPMEERRVYPGEGTDLTSGEKHNWWLERLRWRKVRP